MLTPKEVHVVSVISLVSGIYTTLFYDLKEAKDFYEREISELDSEIYTVYLEENVTID